MSEATDLTNEELIDLLLRIADKIRKSPRSEIHQSGLTTLIIKCTSDTAIKQLSFLANSETLALFVDELLFCVDRLNYEHFVLLRPRLISLSEIDVQCGIKIMSFIKRKHWIEKIKTYAIPIFLIALVIVLAISVDNSQTENRPQSGELDAAFRDSVEAHKASDESVIALQREKLIEEGWNEDNPQNGSLDVCYNYTPRFGAEDNGLTISVGNGTDVALKLVNQATGTCIRYVFVRRGDTYTIRNIPEGWYKLKIAYGKDWFSRVEDGRCVGKFLRSALYEVGDDVFDFNNTDYGDGRYSVPSYTLKLDVIASEVQDEFTSKQISESEFNR
jgi:hypothetical protein